MRRASLVVACGMAAAGWGHAGQDAQPNAVEPQRLLEAMRTYAEQYVANLPNFLCDQVTRQYEAGRELKKWHKGDTLTFRLLFSQGQEQRHLELVNEKPLHVGMHRWRTPLSTEGEFGILLANIFATASEATFTWRGWQDVRGRRAAVFDYSIDQAHSTLKLSLGDLATAVAPYFGSVYADPETGAIWRIEDAANNLPKQIDTKSIATIIDYGDVTIGAKRYLLPVDASITLSTDANHIRNELEFRNYRKFETDSVIKYASSDGGDAR